MTESNSPPNIIVLVIFAVFNIYLIISMSPDSTAVTESSFSCVKSRIERDSAFHEPRSSNTVARLATPTIREESLETTSCLMNVMGRGESAT